MATLAARNKPLQPSITAKGSQISVENHFELQYPHRLNFYDEPPRFDVTLEQFEMWALDRLRVLAEIESSFVRNRSHEDLKTVVIQQQKKYLSLNSGTAQVDLGAERRKDHVSHFVLRLAFCRSEDLRKRFVKSEVMLFKIRFETDDKKEREDFMRSRNFGWVEVSTLEKNGLEKELRACTPLAHLKDFPSERFYKVHWTRVPDLVEKRRVFLKAGMAYVPSREQSSVVFQQFQTELEQALELTAKVLPRMDEDRLTPVLDHLSKGFLAGISSEYTSAPENGESVTADMIDELARKHFPLCMKTLHNNLRKDSHLKHQGRLQYGLFLKIIGLSIEEAIIFWKKAFSKIADDKFNKEYLYNIKHSYGLVGKMANYPARNCQLILTQFQPGPTESHGCPYRHFHEDNLKLALQTTMGVAGADLNDVMTSVRGQHYHVACTRVFEITHGIRKGEGIGGGESVSHPNEYAQRSRELERVGLVKMEAETEALLVDDSMKVD